MNIVILGLSITSSRGNGHATTYRGLVRELSQRTSRALLERNMPWYASIAIWQVIGKCGNWHLWKLSDLQKRFASAVAGGEAVIVGSYVPEGIALGQWVTSIANGTTAFYDIDTSVTVEALEDSTCDYQARIWSAPMTCIYLSLEGSARKSRNDLWGAADCAIVLLGRS